MGAVSQGFGLSSAAFPVHMQGVEWKVELPGDEPAPIWDPGTCKTKTLAARLECWGPSKNTFQTMLLSYLWITHGLR